MRKYLATVKHILGTTTTRTLLVLLFILGVAAFLRLYRISEYLTFLGDEGRDVLVVKRIIVDGKLTLLGPTASVGGFFLGPLYYYFMAPFLWLWRLDPTGPAVMVALFGVATVWLVYRVGRAWFSEAVGLFAAGLYALSPLTIAYSRSSWNPNLVPFFSLATMSLLWYMAVKRRPRWWFGIGILLGMGLQFHYLFLFLFPVVGIWFMGMLFFTSKSADKKAFSWKERSISLLAGIGGFLIGNSLFLLFELRHGFPNIRSIIRFLGEGKDTGFSWETFVQNCSDVTFRLFGRLLYRLPSGEMWHLYPDWQTQLWQQATWVTVFGTLALAVWLAFGSATWWGKRLILNAVQMRRLQLAARLLLLWFGTVIILFGFYKRGIYDYYFGLFFALPFLLLALTAGVIWRWLHSWRVGRTLKAYWAIPVVWIWLLWFNWQGRPFLYPPNNQLEQTKRIARAAVDKAEGKPFNFALITATNSDHAYRYFFEIWGQKPVTIENTDVDPERKSVTDQLIIICEDTGCQPLGHPLWEVAGFGRAEKAGEWDVPYVKVFRMVHYVEPAKTL